MSPPRKKVHARKRKQGPPWQKGEKNDQHGGRLNLGHTEALGKRKKGGGPRSQKKRGTARLGLTIKPKSTTTPN